MSFGILWSSSSSTDKPQIGCELGPPRSEGDECAAMGITIGVLSFFGAQAEL